MKHARRVFALIVMVAMVFTMSFATVGVSAATKKKSATVKVGAYTVNTKKKTVSFKVNVNKNMLDGKAIEHLIINNKNGKTDTINAGKGLFTTKGTALDLYKALVKAGATPWVAKGTPLTLNSGEMLEDMSIANMANPGFSRLTLTFKDKNGKSYKLKELVNYEYKGDGEGTADPFQMCFSGNFKNQKSYNTGCVACLFSCYVGISSNMAIGCGTVGEGADNYFYASDALKTGSYTVTYKVKSAPYNYIKPANLNKNKSDYKVIDVRNSADFAKGHIKGALDGCFTTADVTDEQGNANLAAIVKKNGKDKKYVLCCYSGNKYAKAATEVLKTLGVKNKNIFTLVGGFKAWSKSYSYIWGNTGNIVVDPVNKTIKLNAEIAKVFDREETSHLIGNKDGSNGDKCLFPTAAKPLDVYNAMVALGVTKDTAATAKITVTWKKEKKNDTRAIGLCLWKVQNNEFYDDSVQDYPVFTERMDETTGLSASGCITCTVNGAMVPNRCALPDPGTAVTITYTFV